MRRANQIAAAMIAGATVITFMLPTSVCADWRWGSCLCGCRDRRSPQEWAAEAAALGVKGGAPALGFCGSVTGYERGVIRIPYPTDGTTANTVPMAPPSSATLPPPPAPQLNPTPPAPPVPGLR